MKLICKPQQILRICKFWYLHILYINCTCSKNLSIFCIIPASPGGGTVGDVLEERLNGLALIDACRSARQLGGGTRYGDLGAAGAFHPKSNGYKSNIKSTMGGDIWGILWAGFCRYLRRGQVAMSSGLLRKMEVCQCDRCGGPRLCSPVMWSFDPESLTKIQWDPLQQCQLKFDTIPNV